MKWSILLYLNIAFVALGSESNSMHAHYRYRALIYNGSGACEEGCAEAAKLMAMRVGLTPVFVNEHTLDDQSTQEQTDSLFYNAAVWIQPGGYSSEVLTSMSDAYREAVENFVKVQGGGYVGFCAGAFTSTRYSGTTSLFGFNLMSGFTIPYEDGDLLGVIPVRWKNRWRSVYFEGGPYLAGIDDDTEVISTYANGKIAAARAAAGKGRVFVTGFHPEAPQWWRDISQLKDPDGLDYELVDEMLHWVMREQW